jgi:hypothetical protein
MLNELAIIIIDPFSIQHQLVKIVNILLNNVGHVLQLSQFVPVMVGEHALWTNDCMAKFAEVFNLFVLMLEAKHFSSSCLGD